MARYVGNATGRTLAETIRTATGHLSDKEMPKAAAPRSGNRFSARRPAKAEPASTGDDAAAPEASESEDGPAS